MQSGFSTIVMAGRLGDRSRSDKLFLRHLVKLFHAEGTRFRATSKRRP